MEPMIWPLLLLLLGLFFVTLELFIPSTGVLSVLAGSSVLAAIYVAFTRSTMYGMTMLIASLALVPIVIALAVHVWPRTPIGRRMILQPAPGEDGVLPNDEEYRERRALVGRFGVARSKMLPAGAVVIDGRSYDAVSRGNPIEPGETIRVVSVSGNRIVVAPADPQQAAQAKPQEDPLAQPIDSLGIDPFDESAT